jgi:hypothetical protein
MILCEAPHGRRPWPDLKGSMGAHRRGEGEGKGKERRGRGRGLEGAAGGAPWDHGGKARRREEKKRKGKEKKRKEKKEKYEKILNLKIYKKIKDNL